jgi:hypothetical protein
MAGSEQEHRGCRRSHRFQVFPGSF